MLSVMAFAVPEYDRSIVDLAGDVLIGYPEGLVWLEEKELDYLEITNNWRAAHAYPLNTFQIHIPDDLAQPY